MQSFTVAKERSPAIPSRVGAQAGELLEHPLVVANQAFRPQGNNLLRAIYRSKGWDKANVVEYARQSYQLADDTGRPDTFLQEFVTEVWVPQQGSTSIYTAVSTRCGELGLEHPAPPPPADGDRVQAGVRGVVGVAGPRAFRQAPIQEFTPGVNYMGTPQRTFKAGMQQPVRWTPLEAPVVVEVKRDTQDHRNQHDLPGARSWDGEYMDEEPSRANVPYTYIKCAMSPKALTSGSEQATAGSPLPGSSSEGSQEGARSVNQVHSSDSSGGQGDQHMEDSGEWEQRVLEFLACQRAKTAGRRPESPIPWQGGRPCCSHRRTPNTYSTVTSPPSPPTPVSTPSRGNPTPSPQWPASTPSGASSSPEPQWPRSSPSLDGGFASPPPRIPVIDLTMEEDNMEIQRQPARMVVPPPTSLWRNRAAERFGQGVRARQGSPLPVLEISKEDFL